MLSRLLLARSRQNHGNTADRDPFWGNVGALLHFEGANNSAVFTDSKANVWGVVGSAVISTTNPLYGSGSGVFDGGDYVSTPNAPWNDISIGDFTLEMAVSVPLGNDNCILSKRDSGAHGWALEVRSTGAIWLRANTAGNYSDTKLTTAAGIVPANTRKRIALQRSGDTWRIYCEGVSVAASTITGALENQAVPLRIGTANTAGENYLIGKVDEFRFTKGVARYGTSYVPSATVFPDM